MRGIRQNDVRIEALKAGSIAHAADWEFEDVAFQLVEEGPVKLENCEGVRQPEIESLDKAVWDKSRAALPKKEEGAVRLGVGTDSDDE